MSLYDINIGPRVDLISLEDLAELEAGGKRSPQYTGCLNAVSKEFPSGDGRIVCRGEPRIASLIANSSALKYWEVKYPTLPVPPRIAEPTTTDGWRKLTEGLKADNQNLRTQLEELSKQKPLEKEGEPTTSVLVTFGAVCYLLAKYGVIGGDNGAFQTKGVEDLAPVTNKISSEIGSLASTLTNRDDESEDVGFKDSGRRAAIAEALAAFNRQIDKNKKSKHK